jgi:hypothetical protein
MQGVLQVPLQGQVGDESGRASEGPEAAMFQEPRQIAQRTSHEWTGTLCFWSHRGSRCSQGPRLPRISAAKQVRWGDSVELENNRITQPRF